MSAPAAIVSWDGTANDRDALALGRLLAGAGAVLSLAYVRHPAAGGVARPERDGALALLRRGARELGLPDAPLHVVDDASTGEGLLALAQRERADLVVFGSDYRTALGEVRPGTSAQRLLEGGPASLALAPAGLWDEPPRPPASVALLAEAGDAGATATARSLAAAWGAPLAGAGEGAPGLLVVGSRAEAPSGRVGVGAEGRAAIERAACPVLVLARGVALRFAAVSAEAR
jgi:nucleotide-binding universal stress UspA family protein